MQRESFEEHIESVCLNLGYSHRGSAAATLVSTKTPEAAAELLRQRFLLIELQMAVADVQRRLDAIESQGFANNSAALRGDPCILDLIKVTEELFPGSPEIESESDPSDPDQRFVVLTVRFKGDVRAAIAQQLEWHERVSHLKEGSSGQLRLNVVTIE